MADNYLERKMEEYRSGKTTAKPRRLSPSGQRPGHLDIPYPCRRVYVTGGASGIGRAVVKAFCDAGCKVAFCDIDSDCGRRTAQDTGAQFHPLDVRDAAALEASLQAVIGRWGDIDVVVNNVGVGNFKPFAESTLDEFTDTLRTNLLPVWITAHTLARHRQGLGPEQNRYGRIINISSTRHIMSESGTEAYSASKGAIASLTHALSISLAPLGITVNCISPGWIHTGSDDELRDIDHTFHPSGRVGRPEDIASLCIYLCTEGCNFINGADLVVDGGVTRKMIYPE